MNVTCQLFKNVTIELPDKLIYGIGISKWWLLCTSLER